MMTILVAFTCLWLFLWAMLLGVLANPHRPSDARSLTLLDQSGIE